MKSILKQLVIVILVATSFFALGFSSAPKPSEVFQKWADQAGEMAFMFNSYGNQNGEAFFAGRQDAFNTAVTYMIDLDQ